MNSFTQQLYLRHSGQVEAIRPRQRSLFESAEPRTGYGDRGLELSENPSLFRHPDPGNAPFASYPSAFLLQKMPDPTVQFPDFNARPGTGIPLRELPQSQPALVKGREKKVQSLDGIHDKSEKDIVQVQTDTKKPSLPASTPQPEIKPFSTRKTSRTESSHTVSPQLPQPDWLDNVRAAADTWFRQNTQPVIRVSIGRLEVHTTTAASAAPAKSSPPPRPRMSLEDYLNKQKNNGT